MARTGEPVLGMAGFGDVPASPIQEDEMIIARASSGVALCATFVGSSTKEKKRVPKQLLLPPRECKLQGPNQAFRTETLSFSSIHSSKTFCEHVEKSGWTMAVSASIPWGFGLSGSGGSDKNKVHKREEDHMSTEACQMQYWYFPKASFSIPRHQMRLTEEALDDVGRVRSLADAESFLQRYNSHVSSGRYHLGGVLLKGVTIKVKEATSVKSMLDTVATNLNGEFEFNHMLFETSATVVYMNEHSSSSTAGACGQEATMGTIVTAVGPQTTNDEEFKVRLEDKSTWHIIDSSSEGADLVPVWEIIQSQDTRLDLERPCNLIREAWLRSIASEAHKDDRLFQLSLDASSFTSRSKFANKDGAIGRLKSKLAGIPGFRDLKESPASPAMLNIFQQCWSVAIQMVDPNTSRWDARQLLFELPEFDHLLLTVAQSTGKDMEDGKQFIRDVIDKDVQLLLHEAGVFFKEPVKSLLQSPTHVEEAVTTRLIPLENISPDELLERLKVLVGNDESHLRIVEVTRAIKACLHQDMNRAVKSIIIKQGFDGNGDYCDVDDAAKEHVLVIIRNLESYLMGQVVINQTTKAQEVTGYQGFPDVPQYTMPLAGVFTFHGDVLVDRPLNTSDDLYRNMMDRIRHRIEPFISVSNKPVAVDTDDFDSFYEDTYESNSTQGEPTSDSSPIKILVKLLMRSDLLAQTALFQLLLEQRYSIPLIVPKETHSMQLTAEKIKGFGHLAEALNFVQVKLENQEILSMLEDTKLPRVVFVSNRKVADVCETVDMACKVLNCEFWSKHKKEDIGDCFTVVELGVGFIKTSNDQLHKHRPCLAFCVRGDHDELEEFLMMIADVVIVELEPKSEEASPPQWPSKKRDHTEVLYWNNNSSKKGRKKIATNVSHIWGTFSHTTIGISIYLERYINTWISKGSNEQSATLVECLHGIIPPFNKVLLKFSGIDAPKYESERASFKLQKSFNTEADIYFKSLSDKNTDFSRKMEDLKADRTHAAREVLELPIIRDFLQLLSEQNYVKRRIGILRFQLSIDKQLQPTLERASKVEGDLFKRHQKYPGDPNLRAQYQSAKKEHGDKMLGLEHVWREVSHIYSAKPLEFKQIPKLAAQHLLDGFPLEILDGDATMFQELWVDSVLVNLDRMLHKSLGHKPKIFVLSVVGLQSSGKSTLLNLMFGTQLRTSAGQCTRGVYLQLVKSEWPEFDYVLLLDTEGIRSPEYHGRVDAEIKDNRLATFAVLPADACVVVVANEEDNGLKDVLPMVMLAFKGSAMAEKYAGRMQAKLFFVYRSIDTNDVKKLRKNQQKLQEELRDAASEISEMRICGSTKGKPSLEAFASTSLSINPLSNFNIDEQEEKSDVKYLGNLKKGNVPPLDVPDFDYGERVVELRKYIHTRIIEKGEWEAHKLQDWSEYLKMVWQCIADANFELGFLNRLEYSHYLDLQSELVSCRETVGKKCLEEYEELEQKLQGLPKEDFGNAETRLCDHFMKKVEEACNQERKEVDRILEHKKWQRWKVREITRWEDFCSDIKKQSDGRKQDCITGVLKFDSVVKEYCEKIRGGVESKAKAYHIFKDDIADTSRQRNMERDFDELFKSVIAEATEKYPPLATKVPTMVDNMYLKSPVVGQKYTFDKNISDMEKHDKPDDSIGSVIKRGFAFLCSKVQGNPNEHVHQSVIDELIPKIDKCLQYATQYSDHLVEEAIQFTEDTMADQVQNKKYAQGLHNLVKNALSDKLQSIQQKWDLTHNVAKRLEQERSRLQQFFESCANGLGGTKSLTLELSELLQNASDDSFKDDVARKVVDKLQAEAWVGNWKVMRAHLDLHLLDLIQDKETDELISCVRNGGFHYKKVLNGLIEKKICIELESDLWKMFMASVKLALQTAAYKATKGDSKIQMFLSTLKGEFSKLKFLALAKSISLVDVKFYLKYSNDIDFHKVQKEVSSIIDVRKDIASTEVECVVSLVEDRMIMSLGESARPRCEEECPHCRLTCFLAARHDNRHDTLHQPSGLCNGTFICNDELVWSSCSRSVALGNTFLDPKSKKMIPYTEFSVHYPDWSLPGEGFGVPKVREYIFAHYQEELVQATLGKSAKKSTKIPLEYSTHSIPGLRTELENVLQRFE